MRLFIATDECPDAFIESLSILKELKVRDVGIRLQKENQIHLTLRFIGDLEEEKLPGLHDLITAVAGKHHKEELQFDKWLVFPDHGPVRIIALGSSRSLDGIKSIENELDEGCVICGSPSENRNFIPHLTLARVKNDNSHGELRRLIHELPEPQLKLSVGALILYRSYLKPDGAQYEQVFVHRLK